jgi:hypothetical protein
MSNTPKKEILSIGDATISKAIYERISSLENEIEYGSTKKTEYEAKRYFKALEDGDEYAIKYASEDLLSIKVRTAVNKWLLEQLSTLSASELRRIVSGRPWLCEVEQPQEEPLD